MSPILLFLVCVSFSFVPFFLSADLQSPVRVSPRQRTYRAHFKTFVDVLHFKRVEKDRMMSTTSSADMMEEDISGSHNQSQRTTTSSSTAETEEQDNISTWDESDKTDTFTNEQKQKIIAMSQQPDIFERLVKALGELIC